MALVTVRYDSIFLLHLPRNFEAEVARCVAAALTAPEFEVAPDDIIVELKSFSQRDWHHHADLMVYVLAHRFPHRSGQEEQYAEAITEALLEHFTRWQDRLSIWVYVDLTNLGFAIGDTHYGMSKPHSL